MSSTTNTTTLLQILSISTSLLASGGILTLSLFDIPELRSQPASRALPSTRWLFSRGSHLFPQAAGIASAGFVYLAFASLGRSRTVVQLLKITENSNTVNGYLAAALLSISIAPWTTLVMIPTNFRLIQMNEDMGGARSQESLRQRQHQNTTSSFSETEAKGTKRRTASDSVDGKDEANQLTDLSGPAEKTVKESTEDEDEEMRKLLDRFWGLNLVRAGSLGAGGMVGLWAAVRSC